MNTLKLITLAAFALLFSQCKTPAPTGPTSSSAPMLESGRTLDAIQTQLLIYADSTNGDARAALVRTGNWLKGQPDIQSVSVLDSNYIYFTLQSGLTSVFYLDEVDNNGFSISRGGDEGGGALHEWDALSMNKITNPAVLFYSPDFNKLNTEAHLQAIRDKVSAAGLGLNLTVVKNGECTTDFVDHMADYGLVILDTHGLPNAFLTGDTILDTLSGQFDLNGLSGEINIGNVGYDRFQAGTLMLGRGLIYNPGTPGWQKRVPSSWAKAFKVLLTSKYLLGLPKCPGTVIFGNMCYSGWSQPVPPNTGYPSPIQPAFMQLNPISYYGYAFATSGFSARVDCGFANQMTDSMLTQLLTNTDSTGHCYLQKNGTEFYDIPGLADDFSKEKNFLKHFGADDYSYPKCGDAILDVRDGQKYATVCIGKQVWMAENLRFNAPGSKCYNDQSSNCDIYGKLYNWNTAMNGAAASNTNPSNVQGICPKGWHLPSAAEWTQLVDALGGDQIAGGALKTTTLWQQPNTGATNSSGFNGVPGGFCLATGGTIEFSAIGILGCFLSSSLITVANQTPVPGLLELSAYGSTATYTSTLTSHDMDGLEPCRCVKDK